MKTEAAPVLVSSHVGWCGPDLVDSRVTGLIVPAGEAAPARRPWLTAPLRSGPPAPQGKVAVEATSIVSAIGTTCRSAPTRAAAGVREPPTAWGSALPEPLCPPMAACKKLNGAPC